MHIKIVDQHILTYVSLKIFGKDKIKASIKKISWALGQNQLCSQSINALSKDLECFK